MIPSPAPITTTRRKQVVATTTLLNRLRGSESLDEFVYNFGEDTREFKQVEAAIKPLRLELHALLNQQDVHVGIEIIDPLIFRLIRGGSVDPVGDAVAELNQQSFHEPGFVLYPLHGYGVMRRFRLGAPEIEDVAFAALGIAVVPQTQSIQKTVEFVERAASALGISSPIPTHALLQEHANPRLKWLSENPLMMIRVRSYAVGAYENQSEYMRKLGLGAALVMLLSVLIDPQSSGRYSSSRSSGETLDIRHYLVFENAGGGRDLSYRRVPMNLSATGLAQLSDLNVDLQLEAMAASQAEKDRVEAAVTAMGDFPRANVGPARPKTARTRFAAKVSDSVYWFRRSFTGSGTDHEAIVSLAVSFESLLIDSYAGGVTARIVDRAAHILTAEGQPDPVVEIVRKLFSARGDVVHSGSTSSKLDLPLARKAYAVCLVHLLERLGQVQENTTTAVGDLLGEVRPVRPKLWERLAKAWRAFSYG